jgi:hypothetical protein
MRSSAPPNLQDTSISLGFIQKCLEPWTLLSNETLASFFGSGAKGSIVGQHFAILRPKPT